MAILSHLRHITSFFCSNTGRLIGRVYADSLAEMNKDVDKEKKVLGDTDYYITYETKKYNVNV